MSTPESFCRHGRVAGLPCADCVLEAGPKRHSLGSTDFSMPQERVLVGNFSIDTSLQTVRVESDPEWVCPDCGSKGTPYVAEVARLRAEVERLTRERDEAREAACLRTGHVATGAQATTSRLAEALRELVVEVEHLRRTHNLGPMPTMVAARVALAEVDP